MLYIEYQGLECGSFISSKCSKLVAQRKLIVTLQLQVPFLLFLFSVIAGERLVLVFASCLGLGIRCLLKTKMLASIYSAV